MDKYNEKVIEKFKNPKNMGEIKDADGKGKIGNLICGDVMVLYIKVGLNSQKKETIKDIKYQTFGCVAAISTSSMVTELVKGKTIEEATKINKKDVLDALDGLPSAKIHCSVLAVDALHESIYDYLTRNNKEVPETLKEIHSRIEKSNNIFKEKNIDEGK